MFGAMFSGTTQDEKALVDQFLEFGTRIQRASGNKESLLVVLKVTQSELTRVTHSCTHPTSF